MIDNMAITQAASALGGAVSFTASPYDVLNESWYDTVVWEGDGDKPSLSVLQTKMVELDAELATTKYTRDRAQEMPPLQDLIVALWEIVVEERTVTSAGADIIEAARQVIKIKYPKD